MFRPLVSLELAPGSSKLSQTSPWCTVLAISFTFQLCFQRFCAHAILASRSTPFPVLFFTVFVLFLILYCLLCLCDRVDDVPFEGDQEQAFEEDFQQLAEEGKWPSPSAYSVLSY